MICASGTATAHEHTASAGFKIHDPDEELRLLRDDRDCFLAALSDARAELGTFAEDGVATAECVRNMRGHYEDEIKRLRSIVVENEISRNDDWIRSELEGEKG